MILIDRPFTLAPFVTLCSDCSTMCDREGFHPNIFGEGSYWWWVLAKPALTA